MTPVFRVSELCAERLNLAYPLVQARYPSLGLEDWLKHARQHMDGGDACADGMAGVVSIETVQDYIIGLFTYRVVTCLQYGRILECEDLVALSLYDAGSVAEAIVDAIYGIAQRKRCAAVRVNLPDEHDPLENAIRRGGLLRNGVSYFRPLAPVAETAQARRRLDRFHP